jgi:hypothetical protein
MLAFNFDFHYWIGFFAIEGMGFGDFDFSGFFDWEKF